jgi:hypothetical protein
MNPYLERDPVWESFHSGFISSAQFQITAQLPSRYYVRIESRYYIHEPPPERRFAERLGFDTGLQSVTLDALYKERIGYLAIRDLGNNDLITAIELLRSTNKLSGPHREQYLGKRRELLRSQSHLIEIDLLRAGQRIQSDTLSTCDYCTIASRVENRPQASVWAWRLRDELPVIPVPLRAPDADVSLDLKQVIDQVHDGGRYGNDIYSRSPEPRLSPDDDAWARGFVPQQV